MEYDLKESDERVAESGLSLDTVGIFFRHCDFFLSIKNLL
jgi:hypothetical protein